MKMMITRKSKRRVRLVEQNLCYDQSMNMGAEYTMKRLKNRLSSELVEMLVLQLLGFNEMIQEEIADNLDLYVRNHEVRTTGCPSVDYVLDVCYMWIAAELGEV